MKLYKPLELPLLYETEETKSLDDSGLDPDISLYVIRPMTFYDISGIGPAKHNDDSRSVVKSDGTTYWADVPYKELKKIVDEAMM